MPLLDPDGTPARAMVLCLVAGALAGLPLGGTGMLIGAFGGFVAGILVAGALTVVVSLARPEAGAADARARPQ